MLNLLILFAIVILFISSTAGLHAKMEKHVSNWLIITRCFFFILVDYRMKLATQLVVNKKRHSA